MVLLAGTQIVTLMQFLEPVDAATIYSAPLTSRLNTPCQELFGETVEENFRVPADVKSDELLGLVYLFRQSTGESASFSLQDIAKDGPDSDEEVLQPRQVETDDSDEAYQSDIERDVLDAKLPHMTVTSSETAAVHHPAFVSITFCFVFSFWLCCLIILNIAVCV